MGVYYNATIEQTCKCRLALQWPHSKLYHTTDLENNRRKTNPR